MHSIDINETATKQEVIFRNTIMLKNLCAYLTCIWYVITDLKASFKYIQGSRDFKILWTHVLKYIYVKIHDINDLQGPLKYFLKGH